MNDYRVLQPGLVIDANRNRSRVAFDALGLLVATAIGGKQTQNLGDTLDGFVADIDDAARTAYLADPFATAHSLLGTATTRRVYDLFAFARTSGDAQPQPPAVGMLARETHVSDLAPGQQTRIQLSFSYSDGFGREIQRKVQAEPGPVHDPNADVDPRWVGTGWTIFNNKGKPVRKYEPFFSGTHHCELERTVGVSPVIFYDPLERVVATILPNDTWEKHVIGTWGQADWDANDTVQDDPGQDPDIGGFVQPYLTSRGPWVGWRAQRIGGAMGPAETVAAQKADGHSRTPRQVWLDTLGRPFLTIAHNRAAGADAFFATRITFDIEGNQREVVDARHRVVMRHDVDMLGTRVRQSSMEAGERREFRDVTGQVVMDWGSRGFRHRIEYDQLRRPVRAFVAGGDIAGEIVEQTIEYGDSQPADDRNFRTRVLRQRDAAGSMTNTGYDFKGNPLGATRELATEYTEPLDWSAAVAMDADAFTTASRFDALNRPTLVRTPDGTEVRPTYNEAGLLETLDATLPDGQLVAFITDIDYDARGQRTVCVHGNGSRTEYTYDPLTFRLTSLRTMRGLTLLRDVAYTFDPVGNITRITDDARQPTFFRNRLVEASSDFTYDAVYRLVEATGREHLGQAAGGTAPLPTSQTDGPRIGLDPGDGNAMGRYLHRYVYDEVGNFLEIAHQGTDPAHAGWSRQYTYQVPSQLDPTEVSNRLTSTSATDGGPAPPALTYDEHGNTTSMPELPTMRWNHLDQLSSTARQAVNVGAPETTYYVYDPSGQRVRKVTKRQTALGRRGSRLSERIYVGGFEVYRTFSGDGNTVQLERQTTHIMDDKQRVAIIERRTVGDDGSPQTLVRHQFGDHLGSSTLELDNQGKVISYEEYYPYGSTSYQAVRSQTEAPKRYRYTGMERDEENGLNYHGARYYAPWLARWTSCDPAGTIDGANLYAYSRNSPTTFVDVRGTQTQGAAPYIQMERVKETVRILDKYVGPLRHTMDTAAKSALGVGRAVGNFAVGTFKLVTGLLGASWGEETVAGTVEGARHFPEFVKETASDWHQLSAEERAYRITTLVLVIRGAFKLGKAGVNVVRRPGPPSISGTTTDELAPPASPPYLAGGAASDAPLTPVTATPASPSLAAGKAAPAIPAVRTPTRAEFGATEQGQVFPIPRGATKSAADTGKGVKYAGGEGGGPGLNKNVSGVRFMDPKPGYLEGYVNYGMESITAAGKRVWQAVNPFSGKTVGKADPWWHIRLD